LAQIALSQSFEAAREIVCNETWCSYLCLTTKPLNMWNSIVWPSTGYMISKLPDSQKSFGGQYNLVLRQVPDPLFFALQGTLLTGFQKKNITSINWCPTHLLLCLQERWAQRRFPRQAFHLRQTLEVQGTARQIEVRFLQAISNYAGPDKYTISGIKKFRKWNAIKEVALSSKTISCETISWNMYAPACDSIYWPGSQEHKISMIEGNQHWPTRLQPLFHGQKVWVKGFSP
jgi:hypothetical protein